MESKNLPQNFITELTSRLTNLTGLNFYADLERTAGEKGSSGARVPLELRFEDVNIYLELAWQEAKPPEALTLRLLEVLALEVCGELVREYSQGQEEVVWTWEKVLERALSEQWDYESFSYHARKLHLPKVGLGYPVYIHCSGWTEHVPQVLQNYFPQAKIRWIKQPDSFLWLPVESEDRSVRERQARGESLIWEIHTLLADECGISATVIVGEINEEDIGLNFLKTRQLLEIQRRFFPGQPGLTAWNVGFAALFADLDPRTGKTYVEKVLSALPRDLQLTLEIFLQNDLNIADTARKLFIHRNTLIYRLDRITELTGYNPRQLTGALHLYLAYWLQKHNI